MVLFSFLENCLSSSTFTLPSPYLVPHHLPGPRCSLLAEGWRRKQMKLLDSALLIDTTSGKFYNLSFLMSEMSSLKDL